MNIVPEENYINGSASGSNDVLWKTDECAEMQILQWHVISQQKAMGVITGRNVAKTAPRDESQHQLNNKKKKAGQIQCIC